MTFRDLRADEIEVRVATAKAEGVSLLLYKDARCDMNILDESVTPMNWMRSHTRENANCIVSIWDDAKNQWISKEDTGTESNTEKEKGLASDSFKRACFNWGIGRELYTAPFIWVDASSCKKLKKNDRGVWQCSDKFYVGEIAIENKRITSLTIVNAKTKEVVYKMGAAPKAQPACFCEDCTLQIQATTKRNGEPWSVAEIVQYSTGRFGRALCPACQRKAFDAEKAAEKGDST